MKIDIEQVKSMLCKACPYDPEEIDADSRLVADLELDSFGMLDLVLDFEQEFAISIPDRDIASLHTVQDVVDYIEKKVAEKA